MGMSLALSAVIGKTAEEVVISLGRYASSVNGGLEKQSINIEDGDHCIIQQSGKGVSILYPSDFVEWEESSVFLSRDLQAPVFAFHVHDEDLWMYTFFVNGEKVDQFNPIAEYWDNSMSEDEKSLWNGDADVVAQHIPGLKPEDIRKYLIQWDFNARKEYAYPDDEYSNEDWQVYDFIRKLGLPIILPREAVPGTDTYVLWTNQLRRVPPPKAPAAIKPLSSLLPDENKKPWWKFW